MNDNTDPAGFYRAVHLFGWLKSFVCFLHKIVLSLVRWRLFYRYVFYTRVLGRICRLLTHKRQSRRNPEGPMIPGREPSGNAPYSTYNSLCSAVTFRSWASTLPLHPGLLQILSHCQGIICLAVLMMRISASVKKSFALSIDKIPFKIRAVAHHPHDTAIPYGWARRRSLRLSYCLEYFNNHLRHDRIS